MATESGPFEDVSPIENWDFHCHVSSLEGVLHIYIYPRSPKIIKRIGFHQRLLF